MSDLARSILETVFCFSKSKGNITHPTIDIQDQVPFKVNEVTITPYLVDHSAYGAFMFLIEVEGKRILHTGDFRNHGYKGRLLKLILEKVRQGRHTNNRRHYSIKTKGQSTVRGRPSKRNGKANK